VTYLDILQQQLPMDEGRRPMAYRDTVGALTIGVGRNLSSVGLHDDEIDLLLANDIRDAEKAARALLSNFDDLSDVRKAVVVNMAFNLGFTRFSMFIGTLRAIRDGRWDDAAAGMLDSAWANEVGVRATRLAQMMRSDSLG
jgi:lysozyme